MLVWGADGHGVCVYRTLHPPWAVLESCAPQKSGTREIIVELAERLQNSGLNNWVANVVVRAFDSREACTGTSNPSYKWSSVTADEMEGIFIVLNPCLCGLLDQSIATLNMHGQKLVPKAPMVANPMSSVLQAAGRLVSWYLEVSYSGSTYAEICQAQTEGVAVMELLQHTFPVRNVSVTACLAHGRANLPPADVNTMVKSVWSFPKSHAMAAHIHSGKFFYGDIRNVCAQIVEMLHLSCKDAASKSNNKAGWQLQVLKRHKAENDLLIAKWEMPETKVHFDWGQSIGQEATGTGARAESRSDAGSVRASFAGGVLGPGLRYPVLRAMTEHHKCSRDLTAPAIMSGTRSKLYVITNHLSTPHSELVNKCPHLKYLPMQMAKYICRR